MSEIIEVREPGKNRVVRVDLEDLVKSAGVRNKEIGCVGLYVSQARKLLRYLWEYSDEDQRIQIDEYLATHRNKIGAWKK